MQCFFETCSEAVEHATQSKSFGVYYSENSEPNLSLHIHECCEIFLCLSGGKSFLIDDKVYDVRSGDLFIINQFEAHKVIPDSDAEFSRYIMHVHPTFLYSVSEGDVDLSECFYHSDGKNKFSLSKTELTEFCQLFESLKKDSPYGDNIYKKLRATEILLAVNRVSETHSERIPQIKKHKTVQLAIDYINTNYSQELTLDMIAKNTYVSVNQLCRLFNKYCGTTVTKYITGKRITEAKKLLEEGKSITDTAFMCGFNDYANFIRVFKKTVGVPPGKYKSVL